MRPFHRLVSLVALALAASCASAGGGAGSPGDATDRNVITSDELARSSALNAYDAVTQLRPQFLRARGQIATGGMAGRNQPRTSGDPPVQAVQIAVYVDATNVGTLDALRQISTSTVREIRYYSASDAQAKWGSGHPAGAIQVVLR